MSGVVLHLLVAVHHVSVLLFFLFGVDITINNSVISQFGKLQHSYLTGWNFIIQTAYFSLSLCEDIVNMDQHSPLAKLCQSKLALYVKNLVFTSIVFPVSCLVSTMFWTLFLYDRTLIYPVEMDLILPVWYNHSLHSVILGAALAEMWLVYHPFPRRWRSFTTTNIFCLCYGIYLVRTYWKHNLWPYPMLGPMTWPMRLGFYLLCVTLCILYSSLGQRLNTLIWGDVKRRIVNGRTVKKVS